MYRDMDLEWHTLQHLELRDKNKMLTNVETFEPNDLVYLWPRIHHHYSQKRRNLDKII